MSANLATLADGRTAFAFLKGFPAWHYLGNEMEETATFDEWLKNSGADRNASMVPLYVEQNGIYKPVTDRMAIMGDDGTVYSISSDHYKIHQYRQVFAGGVKVMDSINKAMELHPDLAEKAGFEKLPKLVITAMGLIGDGSRGFMSIGIAAQAIQIAGDAHKLCLNFLTGHDCKTVTQWLVSFIRVVCQNTWNATLANNEGSFKIRHNREFNEEQAVNAMIALFDTIEAYRGVAEALRRFKASEEMIVTFFKSVAGIDPKEKRDEISTRRMNVYEQLWNDYRYGIAEEGLDKNSGLAMWNAVTRYVDHSLTKDTIKRFEKAQFGTGQTLKADAYATLQNMLVAA